MPSVGIPKYRVRTTRALVYRRPASRAGRVLGSAIGCRLSSPDTPPKRRLPDGATIINVGNGSYPDWNRPSFVWINDPPSVRHAANKQQCLAILRNAQVPCLEFTVVQDEAQDWLDEGSIVFERHVVNGTRGAGIEVVEPGHNLTNAPLYTKRYPKTHEFRVHVMNGQVIDLTEKKRMTEDTLSARNMLEDADRHVRNHERGWVFAHEDLTCDTRGGRSEIEELAVHAVESLGLDFAGVDILARYRSRGREYRDAVVCEVNTAPGLECSETRAAYSRAMTNMLGG